MFENQKYKIVFIDDEPSTLVCLKYAVNWEELQIEVCGSALDGETGLELIRSVKPDIVITDVCMPKCSGIDLIAQIRQSQIKCKVILLSAYADFKYAQNAIKLNVTDYLLKPIDEIRLEERMKEIVSELNREREMKGRRLYEEQENLLKTILFSKQEKPEDVTFFESMCEDFDCFISLVIQDDSCISDVEFVYEQLKQLLKDVLPGAVLVIWKNREIKGVIRWADWKKHELEMQRKAERLHVKMLLGVTAIVGKSVSQAAREAAMARCQAFYSGEKEEWFHNEQFEDLPAVSIHEYQEKIREYCMRQDWDGLQEYLLSVLESEYQRKLLPNQLIKLVFDFFICMKMEITKLYPEKTMNVLRHISISDFEGAATKKTLEERLKNILRNVETRMEEKSEEEKGFALVRKAKEYTAGHYQDVSLSLLEVAEYVGVSRNYFSTVFKEYTDKKYWDYLSEYRIEKAKHMLKETTKTNYEIASGIGYKSEYHFSRKFKQITGMTPKEYRR